MFGIFVGSIPSFNLLFELGIRSVNFKSPTGVTNARSWNLTPDKSIQVSNMQSSVTQDGSYSVTRFGEILPLWQNFKSLAILGRFVLY